MWQTVVTINLVVNDFTTTCYQLDVNMLFTKFTNVICHSNSE